MPNIEKVKRSDGKRVVVLRISVADFRAAKAVDPSCCPLANRCGRFPGVTSVYIGATVALLDYKTRSGIKQVRFMLNAAAQRAVQIFDKSKGRVWPSGAVKLLPPSKCSTRKARREAARARRAAGDPNQLRQYKTNRKNAKREFSFRGALWNRRLTSGGLVL
jgi:hypothetical protein